ncbi:MAG: extracellular solute-binding protein [Sterolibacteriaceae bacterium MAG5]|nr:extracellular solute-binding protein [Candidatus Nitricoxidireducens bremensis]
MMRGLLFSLLALASATVAAQEVSLRHALDGKALDALATLVVRFNDEQQRLKDKFKAKVVLEDQRSVEDKRQLPHMAFLDEEDGMAFFGTRPRFRPLHLVMKDAREKFDAGRFYPQVAEAVDDLTGKVQALPMGLALPALYINRDAFRKSGLDPDKPPRTWWEVQKAAGELFDHGYKCPLTSSRFAWVHIENVSSQHGESIVSKSGKSERLTVNAMVNVKHIALLASWHKSFYFHYFGPGHEGDQKFSSGTCAMLTGESPVAAQLVRDAKFEVGVAELPHYDDVYGFKPADVLPDGAALWILADKKKEDYKAVARFMSFLLRPEVQNEWIKATAFLPMTPQAMDGLRASGVAPAILAQAEKRLSMAKVGHRAKNGFGRGRIREILAEEIAFVWQNTKPAKEALDTAVLRANSVLSSLNEPPVRTAAAKK